MEKEKRGGEKGWEEEMGIGEEVGESWVEEEEEGGGGRRRRRRRKGKIKLGLGQKRSQEMERGRQMWREETKEEGERLLEGR